MPAPASQDDAWAEVDPDMQHEGLDLFREKGDIGALQHPSFSDWEWYVYRIRSPEEMRQQQTNRQRVTIGKLVGPLNLTDLMQLCGGGVFEVRGMFGGVMHSRIMQEFPGPIRATSVVSPMVAAVSTLAGVQPSPAPPVVAPDATARVLEKMLDRLERLESKAQPAPAGVTVTEVMGLARQIAEMAGPRDGGLDQTANALMKGIELARQVEGAPESSTTEKILDRAAPMLERLVGTLLTQRRPMPARNAPAPPRPATGSSAAVVDGQPVTPVEVVAVGENYRWPAAIEAMAKAMGRGVEPGDFANTLADILDESELGMVRIGGADRVVQMIRDNAGARFPVLMEPAAETYVRAVLQALEESEPA